MTIDNRPTPGMYLFGRAPKAHSAVIDTYAEMLYTKPNDVGFAAMDVPLVGQSPQTDKLRLAIKTFYKAAAEGMQFEMDRLNRTGRPVPPRFDAAAGQPAFEREFILD